MASCYYLIDLGPYSKTNKNHAKDVGWYTTQISVPRDNCKSGPSIFNIEPKGK